MIAFARRPNRVKNRDLWDIHWLSQKSVALNRELLLKKLDDRKIAEIDFLGQYKMRLSEVRGGQKGFLFEMRRFLMPSSFTPQFESEMWWDYLLGLLEQML